MGACGRKARALIRLPLPNPRRKRGRALSRRRRRRSRRGGGSGGSRSAGSGFSERPRGALRPPLISPRAPEVAGSPQARRPTPTGRPADAPAPICIFSHPPLLWFGECRLKKGGCEAQVANFGALLQSGRPWRSVFGEGGSCSAPIPGAFFGHPLEQSSHISLDIIQLQLEEACAGVDASDPPPPVTDVPTPRPFCYWNLEARRGEGGCLAAKLRSA